MASGGVKRGRATVTGVYKIKCTAEVEVSRRGIRSVIEDLSIGETEGTEGDSEG